MRGGRNKFGPMYKRDRARKLQIMRQRQLAVQALRAVEGNASQLSPTGYQQPYSNMSIKQEIQIPQVRPTKLLRIPLQHLCQQINHHLTDEKSSFSADIVVNIVTGFVAQPNCHRIGSSDRYHRIEQCIIG